MDTKEILELLGFMLSSEYRQKVLFSLESGIKTPKKISIETNIQINHVSNVLRELSEKELVECQTPNLKKGRIYEITKKGKNFVLKIKNIS
jgi:predicted transcriptional regulator|tara:strand:- start:36 stop:308 length:273 start_codon:yes stop_codon:yes gene_type:complete